MRPKRHRLENDQRVIVRVDLQLQIRWGCGGRVIELSIHIKGISATLAMSGFHPSRASAAVSLKHRAVRRQVLSVRARATTVSVKARGP